ncbi:MAG: hypothetical protein ABI972_27500 [Acidobacteriota bacterium]
MLAGLERPDAILHANARRDSLNPLEQYRQRGFLAQSSPLADPSVLPALLADEPLFTRELASFQSGGRHAVPYLLTDAIHRVAQDPALLSSVEALLGTREWVMWGPNIRRATPNQANLWHVDLESLLWPTITVAIGLAGCTPQSATWCIPGTHLRQQAPPLTEAAVLSHGPPEQISDFANGRFYVFDARVWHRGDPAFSRDRVVLFLHYQRAADPRIPLMDDYVLQTWKPEPAPYFTPIDSARVPTVLAAQPWKHRISRWISRVRRQ